MKPAPRFKPAWPVTMPPEEYLGQLRARLEGIRQMLAFLKAAGEVERMRAAGVSRENLRENLPEAIAAPAKFVYDPAHTAGIKAAIYRTKLAAIKSAAGVN